MARKSAPAEHRRRCPTTTSMRAIPKQMVDMAENEMGKQFLEKIAEETATGDGDTMSNLIG